MPSFGIARKGQRLSGRREGSLGATHSPTRLDRSLGAVLLVEIGLVVRTFDESQSIGRFPGWAVLDGWDKSLSGKVAVEPGTDAR
jgi:hypothetical protein